ncbi:MAG: hypothetical protein IKP78_07980 [Ruminococcus sp.]|nr:hypothetical protein [Ruminococcus sp.]
MKKQLLITAVLLSAALFSCGSRNDDPEAHIRTENFTVYTTSPVPQTATQAFTEEFTAPTEETRFTYALNGTDVELRINDRLVKTLSYYYTPDEKFISVADFDFDGYNDIFIPYENSFSGYGYYYCYLPEKKDFVLNDELMEVNRLMKIGPENTLIEEQDDGYIDRFITYQWDGNKLKKIRKTETYKSYNDNLLHTDIYSIDSKGNETLEDTIIQEETTAAETDTPPTAPAQ